MRFAKSEIYQACRTWAVFASIKTIVVMVAMAALTFPAHARPREIDSNIKARAEIIFSLLPAWIEKDSALLNAILGVSGYDLPAKILYLIAMAESSGDPNAESKDGARGLFQFTRSTWEQYSDRPWSEAFDATENIKTCLRYWHAAGTKDPKNLAAWHNAGVRNWRKLQYRWREGHKNRIYRAIYRGKHEK